GVYTDQEEPGLAGVTVRVVDSHGNPVSFLNAAAELITSITTDSLGFFKIFGLPEGEEYKLQFDYSSLENASNLSLSPANVVVEQFIGQGGSDGKDSDAIRTLDGNIAETDLMLPGVGGFTKVNLGLIKDDDPKDATLGNLVFEDANGNGIKDGGETGVAGVAVTLTGAGKDGIFDTADDISQSTTTSNNGYYKFKRLAAGDYKVTFDQPDGFEFTDANVGSNEAKDSDADTTTGMTDVISLVASENNRDAADAGLINLNNDNTDPGNAQIGDSVFVDANGNGLKDSGELGVEGIGVTLTGAGDDGIFGTDDDITATTVTSSRGKYKFRHLSAGDYKVTFDQPDGLTFTQANVGSNEGRDSDVDVNTGMTDVISLAASERNNKVDAGLIDDNGGNPDPGDASLGNLVFEDVNGNGIQDSSDNGIANVQVSLLGAGTDGLFGTTDDISQTTFTGTDGSYSFNHLNAGEYKVTFDQPDGFEFTQAGVGSNEGTDSDADATTGMTDIISLAVSEQNDQVDAGLVQDANADPGNALIGNLVFEDVNSNGLRDSGENGVSGVTVTLAGAGADGEFGTDDDISASTVTSNTGNYAFRHLDAGDYKVTFEQPTGFEFTEAGVGNNRGRDSDANTTTGMTEVFSLAASERNNKIDAGLIRNNNAPEATDDSRSTDFETPVTIDVLGNDSDPDGDTLTVSSLNEEAVNVGQPVDVNNGSVTLLSNGQFEFTPDDGFSGDTTFSYHISDGRGGTDTADVTVTVAPKPNVGPDATDDSRSTDFETPVTIDVLGNDSDPDGDTLTVSSLNGQSVNVGQPVDVDNGSVTLLSNGQFEFMPDDGFSGDTTFSYHISDGRGGTDTADVTVTVAPKPNVGPDATDDSRTTEFDTSINIDVLGNDSDPDGDTLTVSSIGGQAVNVGDSVDVDNGVATLLDNGQIGFNPDDTFSGEATFSYHVSDGRGGTDTANVTVTVEPRPRKNIHASIIGASGIDEGKSSNYKVQLDHAVTEDTVFTLDVHNGSATRVDRNDSTAQNQDIMWGGYYSVGYVDYHGNWVKLAYYVDDRVANGTSLSSGDRAQVGPDGYTTWDYTVEKNGNVQNGGKVDVLVRAGETMSETFEVQTWKEKVTVDRAPWSVQEGYYEGTENFSIKLAGTSGNELDDFKLGDNKTVDIFDKTHYAFVSPIALDLNGDGVQTTALGDTTGTFDLRGDGNAIASGWLSSEDAFLVVDNNGNGTIDDISEMFGGDVGDGFAKLATYDTNGDGLIDTAELLGGGLALWRDGNSNHQTDAGELISLGSQGITSLDTAFVETPVYQNGNVLIEHGSATKADGSKVDLVDAYFQVADTTALGNQEAAFS
ncbi:MAG: SdrD B-like domain-containing protein, partial [Phormidesmis sp.]